MCHPNIRLRLIPAIFVLWLAAPHVQAREPKPSSPDTNMSTVIAQQNFVFHANWIIDYQGNRRQLTPPYNVFVTSDSIECDLPFQGRLYSTPAPEELRLMSIRFTSKKYRYMVKTGKRSGWDITITPADTRNVQTLYFNVANKGWTTLSIRSADRDQVSYEGQIERIPD